MIEYNESMFLQGNGIPCLQIVRRDSFAKVLVILIMKRQAIDSDFRRPLTLTEAHFVNFDIVVDLPLSYQIHLTSLVNMASMVHCYADAYLL
jgi:hypothetical protein